MSDIFACVWCVNFVLNNRVKFYSARSSPLMKVWKLVKYLWRVRFKGKCKQQQQQQNPFFINLIFQRIVQCVCLCVVSFVKSFYQSEHQRKDNNRSVRCHRATGKWEKYNLGCLASVLSG